VEALRLARQTQEELDAFNAGTAWRGLFSLPVEDRKAA
jgi:hypothetical protein